MGFATLADRCAIAEGFGYDPASGASNDARRLARDRPLRFEAAETVPDGWRGFDVAFSHEVLYLLHDLAAHARAVFGALAPGGVYYAVMGVHAASPLMAEWHRDNAEKLQLPPLYRIDDVVAEFEAAGFHAAAAWLGVRFVPTAGHGHHARRSLLDWLDYYCDQKLLLRFGRDGKSSTHCALVDDRRACVLEYNVVRWGRTELTPQAGVAVYVRGESGKLAAAPIYDDVDPPLSPPT